MNYYETLLIVLSIIFIVPNLLSRFKVPTITSIMIAGMVIGDYGLKIITVDDTLKVLSWLGAVFLMFLAGLEVDNETLKEEFKNSIVLSLFSLIIPGIVGFFIGRLLGLNFLASLLMTVIFSSHSVAIVYGVLDELNLVKSKLGTVILSSTITIDLLTLLLLSLIIKLQSGNNDVYLFIIEVLLYIILLVLITPKISKYIFNLFEKLHIQRIHYVLFIIFLAIFLGEFFGIHPIVASFICGVAVSEALTKKEHDELLNKNLNAIGYGFFIPIFFLVLGMKTNIKAIFDIKNLEITLIILITAILSKLISGYIGLKVIRFDNKNSFLGAILTIPKISASLVAATIGLQLGIINNNIFIAIITLSVFTSTIVPIIFKNLYLKS